MPTQQLGHTLLRRSQGPLVTVLPRPWLCPLAGGMSPGAPALQALRLHYRSFPLIRLSLLSPASPAVPEDHARAPASAQDPIKGTQRITTTPADTALSPKAMSRPASTARSPQPVPRAPRRERGSGGTPERLRRGSERCPHVPPV